MAYTQSPPFNPGVKPKIELSPNDYGKPMGKPMLPPQYVGKPKPDIDPPQRAPQKPAYGSSDGSGFDFNKWRDSQHRPVSPASGPPQMTTYPAPIPYGNGRDGGPWMGGTMRGNGNDPFLRGPVSGMPQPGTPEYEAWIARLRGFGGPVGRGGVEMKSGEVGPAGQDPMYGGAGTGPSYGGGPSGRGENEAPVNTYGSPIQRGPMGDPRSGGKPMQPPQGGQLGGGRQPLRPGMEYRPGGGQRPIGGGMRNAAQPAVSNQLTSDQVNDFNAMQGRAANWAQNGGQGMYSETTYPDGTQSFPQQLNQWQQRGPFNNKFYGAF